MRLTILRSEGGSDLHRYDSFEVRDREGMTVLDALFCVREQMDDSVAFRYSCRGAVCGSCAMLINEVPRLACKTQVRSLLRGEGDTRLAPFIPGQGRRRWDRSSEILLEPLPHLTVIKDLVVDMGDFFAAYRRLRPFLRKAADAPNREWRMSARQVEELERYTSCVLCAACHAACPVNGTDPEYLGPASLAKLYRFHIDPRDPRDGYRLGLADDPHGWWACRFYSNCQKVCPKGVQPNVAIARARRELKGPKDGGKDEG